MKKTISMAIVFLAATVMVFSGCGKTGNESEKYFSNTFRGNFFEIEYPDGLMPAYTTDGAIFSGDFDTKVVGYRLPGAKDGQMPKDTDKLSSLGLVLGNFESDNINGHKAYILDSKSFIAAVFPLEGKVVALVMSDNVQNQSFATNAEKMLKSFRIIDDGLFPGEHDSSTLPKGNVQADQGKNVEPENEGNKQEKPVSKKKPVTVDTSEMAAGTFYDSDFLFLKLRPGFILNNSGKTSANIIGRVGDMTKQQQINIFYSPPSGSSAYDLAFKYAGGKKPIEVKLGANTFQSIVNKTPEGGTITFLFHCSEFFSCKIIISGTMQLNGEIKEILSSIIFK